MIVVRYADDSVVGFKRRDDAERFLAEMRERMKLVRVVCAPAQDTPDRVRTTRGETACRAWTWQAGDVQLPRTCVARTYVVLNAQETEISMVVAILTTHK
jgi:hypothetical protein